MGYLIIKAFHIFFVISWMASLLYLWRLLVYQAEEKEQAFQAKLRQMRLKLYRRIAMPGMLFSLVFGFLLLYLNPHYGQQPWLWGKLFLVFWLIGLTHMVPVCERKIAEKGISPLILRWLNELPTLILLVIIFLVVLKP